MPLAKSGILAPVRVCVHDQAGDYVQQDTPMTSGTHGKALLQFILGSISQILLFKVKMSERTVLNVESVRFVIQFHQENDSQLYLRAHLQCMPKFCTVACNFGCCSLYLECR